MKKSPCRVQTLAGDGLCTVEFCPGCNVFHLKIGYATVQIHPEAFSKMCGTINTALALFQRQSRAINARQAPDIHEAKKALH